MAPSRTQIILAFGATTLASTVFLATVEGVYRQEAFALGIVGAFSLAVLNATTDGGLPGSVTLVLFVGLGYVAATKWYDMHSSRLPPIPDSRYLLLALGVVLVGLAGHVLGVVLRDRLSVQSLGGTN